MCTWFDRLDVCLWFVRRNFHRAPLEDQYAETLALPLALLHGPHADEDLSGAALAAIARLLHQEQKLNVTEFGTWFPRVASALRIAAVVESVRQLTPRVFAKLLRIAYISGQAADKMQLAHGTEARVGDHTRAALAAAAPFARGLTLQAIHTEVCRAGHEECSATAEGERLSQLLFATQILVKTSLAFVADPNPSLATGSDAASPSEQPRADEASNYLRMCFKLQHVVVQAVDEPGPPSFEDDLLNSAMSLSMAAAALSRFLAATQSRRQQPTSSRLTTRSAVGTLTAEQAEDLVYAVILLLVCPAMRAAHVPQNVKPRLLREAAAQPGSPLTAAAAVLLEPVLQGALAKLHTACTDLGKDVINNGWQAIHVAHLDTLNQIFTAMLHGIPSIGGAPTLI